MKKVYLETFGCQMNVSDSERILTRLAADGFEATDNEAEADVVLLNTCSVREKAEHKIFTRVGQIRKSKENQPDKKIVLGVMGCVAQLEGETLFSKSDGIDFVLGTRAVGRVGSAIESAFNGREEFADLGEREAEYDWSVGESQRHSPYVGFVPIIEGCNKFCTYCIVPFARGREKSLPAAEIIRQIETLRRQGVREVHLIGQNVNSYRPKTDAGLENVSGATQFSKLLRAAAATGMERIKFTTSFPRDFHPDIIDAINENENLCNWAHLPVQSGSNRILKLMRRGHTIENYLERVDKIKSSPRKIALTTDIIIGFPGETLQDFEDTVKMFEYCQFDAAYIFKYSPRPGTPAFDMLDDVSAAEKNARFLELEKIQRAIQQRVFQSLLNETVEVLAEKISSRREGQLSGHTTCQKVVNFPASPALLGEIVRVRILESKTNTLYGERLSPE